MTSLDQRRALLAAALGFAHLRWATAPPPPVAVLTRWLETWAGIGAVTAGMQAQGSDLEFRQFPHGWRANFYPSGLAHSVVVGSAWEPTAGAAVRQAAWRAIAAALGTP